MGEVRLGKRKPLLDSLVDFTDFSDAFSKVAMFQRGVCYRLVK